jgi:hypothetical protein
MCGSTSGDNGLEAQAEIGGVGRHAPWSMPTVPAYDQELIDISFSGPRRTTLDVPLDTIPVFVRDGAVVPGP